MLPIYITGNPRKAAYISKILGVKLRHHELELDEIQSADPKIVVDHKVRQAYELLQRPVLVEDTSLFFHALNGLPGPFIKFFVQAEDGLEHLCRMLDGFEDRSATASATYAYYDGTTVAYISGALTGTIVDHPRGGGGYGWDMIFQPDGYNSKTRAELSEEDDIATYKKIRDMDGLQTFLLTLTDNQ